MNKSLLPLAGVLVSFALFALAASFYPGGYDWAHDFVSTLFAPSTPSGAGNDGRYLAVAAMFVFCVNMAVEFEQVSRRERGRLLRKTLQIGGIGSMVYAFLVVTPMHDLLVGISLVFFVPAMAAATMYYGDMSGTPPARHGRPLALQPGDLCHFRRLFPSANAEFDFQFVPP